MTRPPGQPSTGELILARLLVPAKRPPTAKSIARQLAPFFAHRLITAEWNAMFEAALEALVRSGDVVAKPLTLTDIGRNKALAWLGMNAVPPRLTWKTLQAAWLAPRALGAPVETPQQRDRLKSADGLRAYVLKQAYGLPLDGCPTLKQAVDALVWKQLGVETDRPVTRDTIIEEVIGRLLDLPGRFKSKPLQNLLPATALGTAQTKPDDLRLAAIRRWIEAAEGRLDVPPPAASNGDGLSRFVDRVHAAARSSTTGRFGSSKVFIGHVWRRLEHEEPFRSLGETGFKQRLIEANRAGLLALSRADLVEAMAPADVAASETPYLNAVFHFVQIPAGDS